METIEDLLPRVQKIIKYHLEDTNEVMSENAAWQELIAICVRNQEDALRDDMGEYVDMYSNRINLVNQYLKYLNK